MHQGSVLSLFLFAVVVDVVTELGREDALCELLYVDDLVLMSEAIKGLRNKSLKWKEALPWDKQGNSQRWHHKECLV